MDLIRQSFKRILSNRISAKLWLALILTDIFGISAINLMTNDAFIEPSPLRLRGLVIMSVVTVVLLLVTQWKLTRALGEATEADSGDVISWIGWSVVAYLPVSLIFWVLDSGSEVDLAWVYSSVLLSVGVSLVVPLIVYADGKAIRAAGPSASDIIEYWSKNYARLFWAYLAISSPMCVAADSLYAINASTNAVAIGLSLSSSALLFINIIICTGITVSAYREVDAATKR
jgi:hypothetical protein